MDPRPAGTPWFRSRTVALGVLVAATIALYATLVPLQTLLYGTPLPLSFLLGAVLCTAPLLAVSHPRWAIALFSAAAFVLPLLAITELATASPWPWSVPALLTFVLFVGVVTFVHGVRIGAFPLVIGIVASLTAPLLRPDVIAVSDTSGAVTANLIVTTSVAGAVFLITALLAGRLRIGEELDREREHSALEQSRRALVEERTRIARELHDVIAHSLSVIQVQSSSARYRLPDIAAEVADEFDDIASTARSSLNEMRRMLGVLRTDDQAPELAPQQGIADIPALVASIRRAGVGVGLVIENEQAASSASPSVQIAAFRIVQEALSNAVRHAPNALVTVRLRADASSLRIRVHNDAPPAGPEDQGQGYGLRGMRERAMLLGGEFFAGPDAHGGWVVDATIPLVDAPEDADADKESP